MVPSLSADPVPSNAASRKLLVAVNAAVGLLFTFGGEKWLATVAAGSCRLNTATSSMVPARYADDGRPDQPPIESPPTRQYPVRAPAEVTVGAEAATTPSMYSTCPALP